MIYICYRLIEFDLQIAKVFLDGSCHSLTRGNVTLLYRIGSSNLWKTLGNYASEGESKYFTIHSSDATIYHDIKSHDYVICKNVCRDIKILIV